MVAAESLDNHSKICEAKPRRIETTTPSAPVTMALDNHLQEPKIRAVVANPQKKGGPLSHYFAFQLGTKVRVTRFSSQVQMPGSPEKSFVVERRESDFEWLGNV